MRLFVLLVCLAALPRFAFAADLAILGPPTRIDPGNISCTLRLSGQITQGDSDRLRSLLERDGYLDDGSNSTQALCLDSPGGALDEGVRIAEVLRDFYVPTVLPAGARCLSACAVAFMGGTYRFDIYTPLQRSMHPTATLGFHAPSLEIPDGSYNKATVTRAFDLAIDAIARIARDLDQPNAMTGVNRFPRSLMAAMLRHRGEDFLWIDTVERATVWGIDVMSDQGVDRRRFDPVQFCSGAIRRFRDQPILEFSAADFRFPDAIVRDKPDDPFVDWVVWLNNESNDTCQIQFYTDGYPYILIDFSEFDGIPKEKRNFDPWMGFRADTRLRDLR